MARRGSLDRDRVLRAALDLVDERGLESLSMRRLAQELGVEAMSLYNHVENKEDVLAGILDLVAAEVAPPAADAGWKDWLREHAIASHEAFAKRPWAARIWMTSSRSNSDRMASADGVLARLRDGGLDPSVVYQAFHVLEGYTLGYTLQQGEFPYKGAELERRAAQFMRDFPVDRYPDLARHIEQHLKPHDGAGSFEFGLDLILDGLERLASRA